MRLLVRNIGRIVGIEREGRLRLCGAEMDRMETLDDAWLLADGGRIAAFGRSGGEEGIAADRVVDAGGGMLFPSFCDSHTHLVYAGSREQEFLDKINGLSYEEIARRGGGILNSADRLHETSEEELFRQAMERVREIAAMGTGAVEIKSGYGLSTEDELKMLRVVRRIRQETPLEVRATFLGAHAVARAYRGRQGEYVDLVCREMLPAVAREGLADFVDVFCDEGFFTVAETERIIAEGARYGLRAKIHANELAVSGGVQAGVRCGALSVDHLERIGAEEIGALRGAETMPTLLPGGRVLPGHGLSPGARDDPRGAGRGARFGLQSRVVAFGRHAHGGFAGFDPDADDPYGGALCRDAQRRLCHGGEPRLRFGVGGQGRQLLPHAADALRGILYLCLPHAAHRTRLSARRGVRRRGMIFARVRVWDFVFSRTRRAPVPAGSAAGSLSPEGIPESSRSAVCGRPDRPVRNA